MPSFDLGLLHPAIVHFPIALIFTALVFDVLYWVKKKDIFQTIAGWLIIIVAIILVPTIMTGLLAEENYPADDPDVFRHQIMAFITTLYTMIYALFRGYALIKHQFYSIYLYLLFSFINVLLMVTTAELGGIVVRGKGIILDSLRSTEKK